MHFSNMLCVKDKHIAIKNYLLTKELLNNACKSKFQFEHSCNLSLSTTPKLEKLKIQSLLSSGPLAVTFTDVTRHPKI